MRKIYSLVLMAVALLVGTNVWAADIKVGGEGADHPATIDGLNAAITAAGAEDVVLLGADIAYAPNGSKLINITNSVTIDGQNHTISGYGSRGGKTTTIAINHNGANFVAVTLKDLTIRNDGASGRPIETRGKITSLTLDNVKVYATGSSGNCQGITIGGSQATPMTLTMTNSLIDVTRRNNAGEIIRSASYAIISFNPYRATIDHCTFYAWAGLYFWDDVYGSTGSVVNVENTAFYCSNYNAGASNAFGAFVCQDDGIEINATNCIIEASAVQDQPQAVLLASGYYMNNGDRTEPISLKLSGDNTRIIMEGAYYGNIDVKAVQTFNNNTWYYGYYNPKQALASDDYIVPFSVTMTGGTYDVNPMYYRHVTAVNRDGEGHPIVTEDGYSVVAQSPIIPAGRAVVTVQDGGKTLYRITDGSVSYDINESYEDKEAGENPTTSFIVTAEHNEDPEQVQPIELTNNETEAAYVQVRDNAEGDATVLLVGKVENAGSESETKVDQTLIVNNGLDVQGESQVVVQSGSTLQIGEGGIVTEKPENIVIEANKEGAASLIMDPAITVNQTPNLTVKMTAQQIGIDALGDYYWHRFALPISNDNYDITWTKSEPTIITWLYGWDYVNNDWAAKYVYEMDPFKGYTLTAETTPRKDITYTFKGNLVGNTNSQLTFSRQGYNFFGNSYTGYISILQLVDKLMGTANVDGSVWMWDATNQKYVAVGLNNLRQDAALVESGQRAKSRYKDWQKEVAPMQTFILRLVGAETATTELNYAEAIWGNPRYGNDAGGSSLAPARISNAIVDDAYLQITVTAANGQSDMVEFVENTDRSDAYERGYDASKYMNERTINLFATVNDEDYNVLATDNLQGKTLSLQTLNEIDYTMSFSNVEGTQYAIRDLMTNIVTPITEGNTYTFVAQPNSTVEGRFVIVPIQNMPTDVETVETTATVKGVYTIMGQYVGEDFESLPAGVYVVDGVKIVK